MEIIPISSKWFWLKHNCKIILSDLIISYVLLQRYEYVCLGHLPLQCSARSIKTWASLVSLL